MKKRIMAIMAVSALLLTACKTVEPDDVLTPPTTQPAEDTTAATTAELTEPTRVTVSIEDVELVKAPTSDFPNIGFTPEKLEFEFSLADTALPADSDAAYIVKKFSYFGKVLCYADVSVMDSHDNEIYSTFYDMSEKKLGIAQYTNRKYNEDGRLTYYEVLCDGVKSYSMSYEYDENGFLTSDRGENAGVEWYHTYVNDGFGNPVITDGEDALGYGAVTTEYTYDTDGNILHQKTTGGDLMGEGETDNEYDSRGRLIKTTIKSYKTPIVSIIEYVYDDNDNVAMEAHQSIYDGEAVPGVVNYREYDAKGRITRELVHYRGEQPQEDSYTVYEYTDLK